MGGGFVSSSHFGLLALLIQGLWGLGWGEGVGRGGDRGEGGWKAGRGCGRGDEERVGGVEVGSFHPGCVLPGSLLAHLG